jgi:hypothetical protein
MIIKRFLEEVVGFVISVVLLAVCYVCAIYLRYNNKFYENQPRLVWGSTPIINYSCWSRAMAACGYKSETYTEGYYSSINRREDWDRILSEDYPRLPRILRKMVAFLSCLFRYDIFFTSFDGFFLGSTWFRFHQATILKLAGKKVVVLPYGSDSYIYRRVRSIYTVHGLLMSYPGAARQQRRIQNQVDYWCENADAIVTGIMGPDGFGRWDVLTPCPFGVDLNVWTSSNRGNTANGRDGVVTIAHAPNHRGFKGTEFIVDAVKKLQQEGLRVDLILIEKKPNAEVRRILQLDTDILVEQIVATGHAMNGLEGMASGLPTICNLEDDDYIMPFRRWSFFGECPLVSATPETIVDVLRKIVTRPELRRQLGHAGRAYAEKYHGYDSVQYLFTNVIKYVKGEQESLINLYHPLLAEYPNRSPKISHPLINNRIVD